MVLEKSCHLQGFGDSCFGGFVDLSLPHSAAAALTELTQTETQILLIGVIFNLQQGAKHAKDPQLRNQLLQD